MGVQEHEIVEKCIAAMNSSTVADANGPVEAARAITRLAQARGSKDNNTAIVMRLGWASAPASMPAGASHEPYTVPPPPPPRVSNHAPAAASWAGNAHTPAPRVIAPRPVYP